MPWLLLTACWFLVECSVLLSAGDPLTAVAVLPVAQSNLPEELQSDAFEVAEIFVADSLRPNESARLTTPHNTDDRVWVVTGEAETTIGFVRYSRTLSIVVERGTNNRWRCRELQISGKSVQIDSDLEVRAVRRELEAAANQRHAKIRGSESDAIEVALDILYNHLLFNGPPTFSDVNASFAPEQQGWMVKGNFTKDIFGKPKTEQFWAVVFVGADSRWHCRDWQTGQFPVRTNEHRALTAAEREREAIAAAVLRQTEDAAQRRAVQQLLAGFLPASENGPQPKWVILQARLMEEGMSPELLIEMNDLLKQHPGTATARTAEPETTGWNKIGYARAYLRFGDVDKARDRLLDVVFHHRGTTAAAEAQRLLDAI